MEATTPRADEAERWCPRPEVTRLLLLPLVSEHHPTNAGGPAPRSSAERQLLPAAIEPRPFDSKVDEQQRFPEQKMPKHMHVVGFRRRIGAGVQAWLGEQRGIRKSVSEE